MTPNDLLACDSPRDLVASLSRWGAGCWSCGRLTEAERRICPHCQGLNALPPLSRRKLRLIACACCRFVWKHLDDKARQTVAVAERFAEGRAILPELTTAYVHTLCNVASSAALRWDADAARTTVQRVAELLAAQGEAAFAPRADPGEGGQWVTAVEHRGLCDAVRDLVDDPARPAVIRPEWLDEQVRGVAACIDLDGRLGDLPILGDALEEAGCDDARLLEHARRPAHYRGCWLLDAVIGKS
jgi:hypothetical protein